ncbi:MAG TPA: glycosyltransferase family 2 protein [Bryobacteraceae bacterium]|nr:glycosyltransferase family 2 protein [Bryobacteraceae bacterium]
MAPRISVVIPVYNGGDFLRQCLESLAQSAERPFETIVIDDGSTDDSVKIAKEFGVTVLSTEGRCGPARARNIGAKVANGDVLFFVDSDVCVYPETLSSIAIEFTRDPKVDAIMGSYDRWPSAQNFMSQYRNLMHHYVHQQSKRDATTFWAGCGSIRRNVFMEFGGFDEMYRSPAIEDIELGYRLAAAGRKLILCSNIQVKHLKRWGLRSTIKTDFFYRALPWSELTLQSGSMPNDLNLRISQRISVALVCVLGLLGAYLAISRGVYFLLPLFATFFILLSYYWLDGSKGKSRAVMSLMVVVMAAIAVFAYVFHMLLIIAMVALAWLALFARHRYAYPYSVWHRWTGTVIGIYCLMAIGMIWIYLPMHPLGTAFLIVLLTLIMLNKHFYLFLAGERGKMFALAAIPFHLLYFLFSAAAFMLALIRHRLGMIEKPTAIRPEASKAKVTTP